MRQDGTCRYVLFTNLDWVNLPPMRTQSHALLLEEFPDDFGEGSRCRLRGFGTDPTWPVFDLGVSTATYELVPAASQHVMISDSHPEPRPLMSGAIMKIGAFELQLVTCDSERPIDVSTYEGQRKDSPILKVWERLPGLVAEYWTAPNMPRVIYGPSLRRMRASR